MYSKFASVGAFGSHVILPAAAVHSSGGLNAMLAIQAIGNNATKTASQIAPCRNKVLSFIVRLPEDDLHARSRSLPFLT
jgi:hypothetical protein